MWQLDTISAIGWRIIDIKIITYLKYVILTIILYILF